MLTPLSSRSSGAVLAGGPSLSIAHNTLTLQRAGRSRPAGTPCLRHACVVKESKLQEIFARLHELFAGGREERSTGGLNCTF